MFKHKTLLVGFGIAILGLAAAPRVNALATPGHTTFLTFNAPFALPGVALPAGTYSFEIMQTPGTLAVVQVSSMDRRKVYLTALTMPVSRPGGLRDDRQISFAEVRAGIVPPVKAWYPLTDSLGHQFIYPKDSPQLATR